jgi:hypothetical protein
MSATLNNFPRSPDADVVLLSVPKLNMPPVVNEIISTPLGVACVRSMLQQGFAPREAALLATSGALASALACTPELIGDLDIGLTERTLDDARKTLISLEKTSANDSKREVLGAIVSTLMGIVNTHNSEY